MREENPSGRDGFPAFSGPVERAGGKVTFGLYAPGKKSVHLVGDFNDWNPDADPMEESGGLWLLEKQLPRGSFYYRFLIDKKFQVCDPYARYYEKEPGKTPEKAIVRPGADDYPWKNSGWRRPNFPELVICEMHIADFTPQRDFREAVRRLDYIRDSGANAIELMPVFGVRENKGWGYTPVFFFAPNEDYGTADELKWFIDEAHGRGIAVILDMVLAHSGHEHPFNRMYDYGESPWYGTGPAGGNEFGLPQFDYSKPATRAFIRSVLRYWLEEFCVDGFRFDYLRNIGMTREGHGIRTLVDAVRSVREDAFLIGEHLPEDPGLMLSSGMDGAWHARFSYALKALLCRGEKNGYSWADFENAVKTLDPGSEGYGTKPGSMVNYIESHDEDRIMFELKKAGFDEESARRRSALGATVLLTAPGVPMLYHGQSFGHDTPLNMDHDYISWEALDSPGGRGLDEHYRRLAWLRREQGAIRSPGISLDAVLPEKKCVVYSRWENGGRRVSVAVNFSDEKQMFNIPLSGKTAWKEFFSGEESELDNNTGIEVEPVAAKIFLKV